jgi:SAM-dependent methyltransferase
MMANAGSAARELAYGGGMNASAGFPIYFAEVSQLLGRYAATETDMRAVASNFPPARYGKALDICCGTGRAAGTLASLGYEVTAVDLSSDQIEIAKTMNFGPKYLAQDMADLPPGPFDILLNIYTSFGYFATEQEDIAVLTHWGERLREGGLLVMELADMERARNRIPREGKLQRHTNGVAETLTMDWDRRLLDVAYRLGDRQWSCVTRLYEKEILARHLLEAGFSSVELYGSFDLTPKAVDDNLVLIAKK